VVPRILVIDDQYGAAGGVVNTLRQDFCFTVGLRDVAGDCRAETMASPVAEAVFISGQKMVSRCVENDLEGTLDFVWKGWNEWPRWSLILLDMHFKTGNPETEPDGRREDRIPENYFGLKILKKLTADEGLGDLPVVILSSMDRGKIEQAITEHGALHFTDKAALDRDSLSKIIHDIGLIEDDRIIGRSLPLLKCLREARRRAGIGNENILILGETGTGKELIAKYIHENAMIAGRIGKFVTVFTSGGAETLIDDRLFGHKKGSYTGAIGDKPGATEEADGGTLFIDEFGNIPRSIQPKLLRFLDKKTRESQRLGGSIASGLDVLVVMATNRMDIGTSDEFFKDLLSRAQVEHSIIVPSLRQRREDIPVLTRHFLDLYEEKLGAEKRTVSGDAMAAMMEYEWPRNVRQLENVIEQAVSAYKGLRILSRNHLNFGAQASTGGHDAPVPSPADAKTTPPKEEEDSAKKAPPEGAADLFSLMEVMNHSSSASLKPENIAGNLSEVQDSCRNLVAEFVKAALLATRRGITRENPAGEIMIQPAMRLITGNQQLTGSEAADLVKRLRIFGREGDIWEADEILRMAYGKAKKLRPSYPRDRKK